MSCELDCLPAVGIDTQAPDEFGEAGETRGSTVGRDMALARLPAGIQDELLAWHAAFKALGRPIGEALTMLAERHGCHYSTARKRYDLWLHNGKTPLAMAPASAWVPGGSRARGEAGPTAEFGAWFHDLCLQFNRSSAAAYREFARRFKRGDLIPGLEHVLNRRLLPRGYSKENLARFAPNDFARVAARIGRRAAGSFRPLVYTTRAQMQVGHQYETDDMWHDFKVVMIGQPQPMRLLALHALDVCSGCLFAHAEKPRLWDETTGKSVGLKEHEFLFFLVYLLCNWGFHPDGTTVLGELGTASMSDALADRLADVTGGLVRFEGGKVDRRPAFGGQFAAVAKGNFRLKAHLESLHNLAHNETANRLDWPGQTGSLSRVNEPEGLAARERHERWIMQATNALPVAVAQAIAHDFVEFHQAVLALAQVWNQINARTDHDLEGFEEAGFMAVDWVGVEDVVDARTYAQLPPAKQEWVRMTHAPRARRQSPTEVFAQRRLIRLRPEQAARLLARVPGREVKVGRNHLIEFEDREIGPGVQRFRAGGWSPGDKFRSVVNPYWPDQAHLFGPRGEWLGAVDRLGSVDRLDVAALEDARRERSADEQRLLAPVARAGAAETRARLENARHNAGVIGEQEEALRAERKAARRLIEEMHA